MTEKKKSALEKLIEEAQKAKTENAEKMGEDREVASREVVVDPPDLHPAVKARREMERGTKPPDDAFAKMMQNLGVKLATGAQGAMPAHASIDVQAMQIQPEGLMVSFRAHDFTGQLAIDFQADKDLGFACEAFKDLVIDAIARRING